MKHYSRAYLTDPDLYLVTSMSSEDPKPRQVIELYSEGTQTHLFCLTAEHLAKFTLPANWISVE